MMRPLKWGLQAGTHGLEFQVWTKCGPDLKKLQTFILRSKVINLGLNY